MLWIKSLHIIAMVTWFAGLFYLPRLYVYHSQAYHSDASDPISIERFKVMERKLFFGIMTPSAVITVFSGGWIWLAHVDYGGGYGVSGNWLLAKLVLVGLVIVHHFWCYRELKCLANDKARGHVYYRWMNEVPVLYLIAIVILVVVKPF